MSDAKPLSLAEVAHAYDEQYRRAGHGDHARFYRRTAARAGVRPGEAALDIGCGAGALLAALCARGAHAWGVDISREALWRAGQQAPRAHLMRADGARLPFADGAFRHVFQLGNLEHFVDLDGGIREIRRVLAPGGRAWVLLPNLFYSGTLWRVLRGGPGPDHHQPIDRFATFAEWRALLEAGGLRVRRWWPHHRGKWWKTLLPRALAWHFLYEVESGPLRGTPVLAPLGRVRHPEPGAGLGC